MSRADAIFIHAWWRSGSTYVWSKLRENEARCCYYEPLNERVARLTLEEIAVPDVKISQNLRHPIPKKHYYAEYERLLRSGNLRYSPELAHDHYLLLPGERDDRGLFAYLDGLISNAAAAERRAVLCFCRSQMRSAWMKQMFGPIHVAQLRNPLDQWASFNINDSYFRNMMITIALKLRNSHPLSFAHIKPFERLAQHLAKRPSMPVELISKFVLGQEDVLAIFLVIWIASALQAIACCDFLLDIDLLSTDLHYRDVASQWFESINCAADFSDCSIPTSGEPFSDSFEQAVREAVGAIRSGASSLVVTDPEAVKKWLPSTSPLSSWVLRFALAGD